MDPTFRRSHPALTALVLAIPVIALLLLVGPKMGDEAGHAASHLAIAVPALLLLASSRRWRERGPGRVSSIGRSLVLIGLGLVGGGQAFEALGAIGFEGYARQYEGLATLHDIAMFSGPPGLLLLVGGGILTGVARMNERAEGSGRVALATAVAVVFGALLLKFTVLGA